MPLCGVRIKERETKGRRADKESIEEIQVRNNEDLNRGRGSENGEESLANVKGR